MREVEMKIRNSRERSGERKRQRRMCHMSPSK